MALTAAQGLGYISAVGSILEGFGSMYSAAQAKKISKYNAKIAEAQAALVETNMNLRTLRARKEMKTLEGAQIAGYAKSGVRTMTGSPIDVMVDSRANLELELSLQNINDRVTAAGYRSEALLYKAQGAGYMAQGYSNVARSLLSAGYKLYESRASVPAVGTKIGGESSKIGISGANIREAYYGRYK